MLIILHHIDTVWPGLVMLQKSSKDPCAICLSGVSTKSSFCVACSSWVLRRCNVISDTLKPDPIFRGKRCTWLAKRVDNQWQRSQREGRRLGWCHPPPTLGTDKPRWQLWTRCHHKAPCSMGPAQWAPAQAPILTCRSFPITSRESLYICMHAKPGPQPHLISIISNSTTELWSAVCAVSTLSQFTRSPV